MCRGNWKEGVLQVGKGIFYFLFIPIYIFSYLFQFIFAKFIKSKAGNYNNVQRKLEVKAPTFKRDFLSAPIFHDYYFLSAPTFHFYNFLSAPIFNFYNQVLAQHNSQKLKAGHTIQCKRQECQFRFEIWSQI